MLQIAASRRLLAVFMLSLASFCASCFTAADKARLAALTEGQKQLAQALQETSHTLATHLIEEENEKRHAERERYCKAPEVIGFMDQIQAGLSSACNPVSMASTLSFLDKIPTVCAHLDPAAGLNSLLKTRIGQIRRELAPEKLRGSTRILLMVKPAEDTEPGRELALSLARQVKAKIVQTALPQPPPAKAGVPQPREVPIMGPHLLPCELSQDIGQLYKKPYFRPITGEPKPGKPDVVIFVVVSPC